MVSQRERPPAYFSVAAIVRKQQISSLGESRLRIFGGDMIHRQMKAKEVKDNDGEDGGEKGMSGSGLQQNSRKMERRCEAGMIEKLYKNIADGLKAVRPYNVYTEDVPQDFTQPSFLIAFQEQKPARGINGRLKNWIRVDVSYFPEAGSGPAKECWIVGQDLSREFAVSDFRIKNRNLKTVDHVLHFMFDVGYQEYLSDGTQEMQVMTQDTKMKEV